MMNKQQTEQEIKEAFGFVPGFYKALPEHGLAGAWGIHRDLELGESHLDHKTKELIGLSMAAHIKCKYCIYFHTQAARTFGATDEEVKEAIQMAGNTVMYSNNITGVQYDYETFKSEVDRGLAYMKKQMQQQGAQV